MVFLFQSISIFNFLSKPYMVTWFGLDAIHMSSVSHGASHLQILCLDLSYITQGQNIDQRNQVLSTPIENDFPSSCHTLPNHKKGPSKATCLRVQGTGEKRDLCKLECDLHGKSLRRHLLIQRSLSPSS